MGKKFCNCDSKLLAELSKLPSTSHLNFFTKNRFFKKYVLSKSFSDFTRKITRYEAQTYWQSYQYCIQGVWRNFSRESFAWKKMFLNDFFWIYMGSFFEVYANVYWQGCQNCTLCVHRIVLMGNIFFEKNTFSSVFRILGVNVSGVQQNFSSTVVRAALFVSRGTFHEEKPFEEHCFFSV